MKINETFYSVQGEGRYVGCFAFFIRTQGCNLRCDFCDTKYTWDKKGGTETSVEELIESSREFNHIVISGGEPCIDEDLEDLLIKLQMVNNDRIIEVETNGLIYNRDLIVDGIHFNVSPKLDFVNEKYRESLRAWNKKCDFKFVIRDENDLTTVHTLCTINKFENIILMPEGTDSQGMIESTNELIELMKEKGLSYRIVPRLHTLLYGNKRGV